MFAGTFETDENLSKDEITILKSITSTKFEDLENALANCKAWLIMGGSKFSVGRGGSHIWISSKDSDGNWTRNAIFKEK